MRGHIGDDGVFEILRTVLCLELSLESWLCRVRDTMHQVILPVYNCLHAQSRADKPRRTEPESES